MEIWKPINGYEGLYEVSTLGSVRNVKTKKMLKTVLKRTGYREVCLTLNGKKFFLVHRLVANAFIKNPNNLPCVNHIDENKQNNMAENLEWCSFAYNCTYGDGSKRRDSPVVQFTQDGSFVKMWESMKDAEDTLGIRYQNISAVCRNKHVTAGGYVWEYAGKPRKWKIKPTDRKGACYGTE